MNADDIGRGVGEIGGPGGFSIHKEGKMTVNAGQAKGCPLGEVAAEAGEVCIPAGYGGAGGIEAKVADTCFCCQGDDEYVVLALYQYLGILADAGSLRRAGLYGGFEVEIGVVQVSQIFHVKYTNHGCGRL